MRCKTCGREIKPGQMFCQCGATVADDGTGGVLNVNRGSSAKTMVIAAAAGFLLLVLAAVGVVTLLGSGRSQITDRTKWETVSYADYQMTIPGNMKESDILQQSGGFQHLNTFRNSEAIIDVGILRFTEDQKRYFKRKKVMEMFKELLPAQTDDAGNPLVPLEHGNMVYIEYTQDAPGVFLGSNEAKVIDACFISNGAFYEVQVYTPSSKWGEYEEYVFAWLDSFRAKT